MCVFHDVAEMPDRGSFTNVGTGIYAGSFVDFGGHGVWEEGRRGKFLKRGRGEKGKIARKGGANLVR